MIACPDPAQRAALPHRPAARPPHRPVSGREWCRACCWLGTSPVRTYPPNGYGLFDLTGNVWEWTSDTFHAGDTGHACCAPERAPQERFPRRVIKGGSHLCAPNYCLRFRPAARQGEAIDTSTAHIGFRCVIRDAA